MRRRGITRGAVIVSGAAALALEAFRVRAAPRGVFLHGEGMPYEAFDRLPKTELKAGDATIRVGFAPGAIALGKPAIFDWIAGSAESVVAYYGHFPVRSLRLLIVPVAGAGVQGGTTWGYRGAASRVLVGEASDAGDLARDWVMVHEMVHLAAPQMDAADNWLAEGLAVYVEPIARVQAGRLSAQRAWFEMARDMPKGLPRRGDGGLDGTTSWGRTYWGGALFCLLADLGIRRETDNRLGLQHALRGVLAAGGNHEADWPLPRVLSVADKAVGVQVLAKLHAEMGRKPVTPDLAALWRELGVRIEGEEARFNESAPLAATRAAITAPF